MAGDCRMVREVEGDDVVRAGDTIDIEGVDWTVENITTRPDGVKDVQVRRSGLRGRVDSRAPGWLKERRSSTEAYVQREGMAGARRDVAAWQGYPPDWPACACGLPTMEGHSTCGRAGCGGL